MKKLTIEDLEVKEKRVFLRVDFNVPLDENRNVTDDTRIQAALPTINYLSRNGAKIILASHLGRPKGQRKQEFSLKPVAAKLSEIIGHKVLFSEETTGKVPEEKIKELEEGNCLLLENLRFDSGEEANDELFAKSLASLADVFVNDAFGTAHRAHASNVGIAGYFSNAACGFLMKSELESLGNLVDTPAEPFCAIIGGAKVKDKIGVITNLLEKATDILIGGGMAYTFLKVKGGKIGSSILDEEHLGLVEETFEKAEKLNRTIHLPVDHLAVETFSNEVPIQTMEGDIDDGFMGMDIGPKTVSNYKSVIGKSKTIFWNGPMGVFEMSNFNQGTFEIAKALSESNGITVVGGGDSVAAVNLAGLASKMTHISTGGGASLKLIQGSKLPGVEALAEK